MLYNYKCSVVRVIDGDTVVIDIDLGFGIIQRNVTVRLFGIDTPELRASHLSIRAAARRAKVYAEEWLARNCLKGIIYRSAEYTARDGFGRYLGDIVSSTENEALSEYLVKNLAATKWIDDKDEREIAHLNLVDQLNEEGELEAYAGTNTD